jgi:hypothetical protein
MTWIGTIDEHDERALEPTASSPVEGWPGDLGCTHDIKQET